MFGVRVFIIKTILIWSVISVILVESGRQKKDVHHMIILNEEVRPSKTHRYKNRERGANRTRKKPTRSNKYKYSSSSEESPEDFSLEELRRHKPKPKRQQHEDHKAHHHKHNPRNHSDHQPYRNENWIPMTSQELYGKYQYPTFPGGYRSGTLHFPQSIPMEITTPFSLPSNTFFSYGSNPYPPVNPGFDMTQTVSPSDGYKPYDYSVLEQQPSNLIPEVDLGVARKVVPKEVTPLSIIVDNEGENKSKEQQGQVIVKNKDKRNRGTSRFRARRKNKN